MKKIVTELWTFTYKQAWASAFAGTLLLLIILTNIYYPFEAHFHRYDFLFISAVILQILLILSKMEEYREVLVILLFHIVATIMEIFKTSDSIGAWHYPGSALFHVGNMPLFAGFMYSAVGSYIARIWRVFNFKISKFPSFAAIISISVLIYVNFFSHHFLPDIRIVAFAAIIVFFCKTKVTYKICYNNRSMPLLIGLILVSFFIWIAENIATYCKIWLYPHQFNEWEIVPVSKLMAWFLLMFISFTLVSLLHYKELRGNKTIGKGA